MNHITCPLSAMIWDECSHCEGVGMYHRGCAGSYSWSVQQMGVSEVGMIEIKFNFYSKI